jgi:hypothetical protein
LQALGHLLEAVAPVFRAAPRAGRPRAVGVQGERAGREPEHEDGERGEAHLPLALSDPVH